VRGLHQHRPQVGIAFFADVHLRRALSGVSAPRLVMVQRRPSELAAILRGTLQEVHESLWRDSPESER
jgi:hypothetical protein